MSFNNFYLNNHRLAVALFLSFLLATNLHAQNKSSLESENLAAATGHFARARSLLIEAVREFDRGTRIASPDALLDSKGWRTALIDRAEEMERVLDPQPRVSKSGIKYSADKRLLNEAKD